GGLVGASRLCAGLVGVSTGLLRRRCPRPAALAYDGNPDLAQPGPDPGDVPARGRPRDPPGRRRRPGRGILMDTVAPTDPCFPLASEAPVVRAEGVNFSYGDGEARFQVLFDNRIAIEPGQLVVMTGPSGSGKTTLLTLIGGLRSLQEGRIEVLGHDLSGLGTRELVRVRRDIGFIFQLHNLFESLTAYENVKMAVQLASERPAAAIRERAVGMLQRLGLGHRVDHKPHSLSGGQRQRVAIARALANYPRLVLADEPTAALDKDSTHNVVRLFKELTVEHGTAILMVTHDHRIIELADRLVHMVD